MKIKKNTLVMLSISLFVSFCLFSQTDAKIGSAIKGVVRLADHLITRSQIKQMIKKAGKTGIDTVQMESQIIKRMQSFGFPVDGSHSADAFLQFVEDCKNSSRGAERGKLVKLLQLLKKEANIDAQLSTSEINQLEKGLNILYYAASRQGRIGAFARAGPACLSSSGEGRVFDILIKNPDPELVTIVQKIGNAYSNHTHRARMLSMQFKKYGLTNQWRSVVLSDEDEMALAVFMALDKDFEIIGLYGNIDAVRRKALREYVDAVFKLSSPEDPESDFFNHRFWAQVALNPDIRTIKRLTSVLKNTKQMMMKYNENLPQAWQRALGERTGNDPEIRQHFFDLIRKGCFFAGGRF